MGYDMARVLLERRPKQSGGASTLSAHCRQVAEWSKAPGCKPGGVSPRWFESSSAQACAVGAAWGVYCSPSWGRVLPELLKRPVDT